MHATVFPLHAVKWKTWDIASKMLDANAKMRINCKNVLFACFNKMLLNNRLAYVSASWQVSHVGLSETGKKDNGICHWSCHISVKKQNKAFQSHKEIIIYTSQEILMVSFVMVTFLKWDILKVCGRQTTGSVQLYWRPKLYNIIKAWDVVIIPIGMDNLCMIIDTFYLY